MGNLTGAKYFIRGGLAFILIYAAIEGFVSPKEFIKWFPDFFLALPLPKEVFDQTLLGFGVMEIGLALWILMGKRGDIAALQTAGMIAGIIIFNLDQITVLFRNVGIIFGALALFLLERRKPFAFGKSNFKFISFFKWRVETFLILFLLRGGLAFVFLYACIFIFIFPERYIKWLPDFYVNNVPPFFANGFLIGFALVEVALVLWLLFGRRVEYAALIAAVILLIIIIFNVEKMPILFRNIGLLGCALTLYVIERKERNIKYPIYYVKEI